MRPYPAGLRLLTWYRVLLQCSLVILLVTPAESQSAATPAPVSPEYAAKTDPLTRSGFEHYYQLDYERAIRDFELVLEKHPEDPFAINHVVEAVFFRELYKAGVLDTGLYASNRFLTRKRMTIDAKIQQRIRELTAHSLEVCEQRVKANSKDPDAYYARGVAKGLQASYVALVERSWFAALGGAKSARKDHDRVLALDPNYSDAKLVVGMHDYIVGSLPWAARVLAHVVGESGNKARGLKYLSQAGDGGGEAAVDAKVVLGVFLRREQRYQDAIEVGRSLREAHPHNFLFAVEEANVLKDWGKGPDSIAAYRKVLAAARERKYFDPHLESAYWGLGEALRGQRDFDGAASAYVAVPALPHADSDVVLRANLAAGQMFDVLQKRELALKKYQAVLEGNANSEQASLARRLLKEPYRQN